jgi:hypothetical protein
MAATAEFPEFQTKLKSYTELVDRLEKDVGKLPDRTDAERVHAHKKALAEAIAKARPTARQGDLFTVTERARFVAALRDETGGRAGAPARKAIAEDNPKATTKTPQVVLAPNAPYPEGAPLSTVPPRVLLRLPTLPESVDFRFVGKALVLRDVRANVIVDYIPGALP